MKSSGRVELKEQRFRLSYANVVSSLALFVALGGTAFAAGLIDGKKIKRGSITGKQIKAKSIPGADLRPNSVRGKQVREATLGRVPRAARADAATHADQAALAEQSTTAGLAAVASQLTPAATNALTDSCPPGTTPYAGACIETEARTTTTWPAAAKICGDAGGRLPALAEIEGFRQQPGVTLIDSEHTSEYLDLNGIPSGGQSTVAITDGGTLSPGMSYGTSNGRYRCVYPMTNR